MAYTSVSKKITWKIVAQLEPADSEWVAKYLPGCLCCRAAIAYPESISHPTFHKPIMAG